MMDEQKYDVFLSYSRAEHEAVEVLARSINNNDLQVWLDKWILVPGQRWKEILEDAMRSASTIAVCIGRSGLDPLQEREYQGALHLQTIMRAKLLIPVLLPGADMGSLPDSLRDQMWIDLRGGLDNSSELARLTSAIASARDKAEIAQEQNISNDPGAGGDRGRPAVSFDRVTAGGTITVNVTNFETSSEQAALLGTRDHYVVLTHNERAERELSRLLMQRSLSPDRARQALRALTKSVTDGDLLYAERSVRAKVLYWSARLHATLPETLSIARSCLDHLHHTDPNADRRIVDALILETEGNVDGALQILRDIDTPDGRATLFGTLFRTRGAESALSWFDDQPERDHASFLTGLGWSNVAVSLTKMSRWEEAANRLAAAQEHQEEWPDLAFVAGIINVVLLFPLEWREYALEVNPFYTEIRPIEGIEADRSRDQAKMYFEKASTLLVNIDQHDGAQAAQAWLLWLKLTDPVREVASAARQEVQRDMQDGQKAVDLLPAARAFNIEFDEGSLQRYLLQREHTGGLNGRERLAMLFLAQMRMAPGDFSNLLEYEETRFSQVVQKSTLAGMRIEALVQDRQIIKARDILEAHRGTFLPYDYERLTALIDTHEGNDPRTQFEDLYRHTGDLLDLKNLINHLREARDWTALQPLLDELFMRQRTLDNALQLVESMRRHPQTDYAALLAFFEANQDLVERNLDLASEQAWALSHVGRLKEAEAINHRLLGVRDKPIDLLLETNLALQSGNWERFPGIIDRAWPLREELEPSLLIRLASFAAETDATANRALELAKLAAGKAGNDPEILLSAYTLGVQLGREDETGPEWISRAIELSSDEGPIWRVNVRTIAEEMMPKRRELRRTIEQELLRGKIPLHAAAHTFHQPLSRILIGLPRNNEDQQDGRRRAIVPIISGARQMMQMEPAWSVGFDVTSLMVLHHLGLLKKAIDSLHRVALAPDTMVLLLNERRSVRFHQPSLVKKAEEIRALIDQGYLGIEQSLPKAPEWLVNEVGSDLAELLEAARVSAGRVVQPYPIHKSSTFGEVEAELGNYAEFMMSTNAFTGLLYARGLINSQTHADACQFLRTQDRDRNEEAEPSLLERPLYLDDLAIGYLQEAGLLQVVCHRGLKLFVHPSTKEYQSALIQGNREGDRLAHTLDEIRVILRDALERGQAIFLPRHHRPEDETPIGWLHEVAPALAQILGDARACNAVCVDDRFFNRHLTFTDEAGHTVLMFCVLDLLQYLEARHVISSEEKHTAFYNLRQAGYALVPVPPDELEKYLRNAMHDQDGQIIESAEMRILRQTLMRIRSLDMVELPTEASFLEKMQLGCIIVIRHLWADEALSVEHVVVLSDWVWRNVAPSPLDWARNISEPLRPGDIPEAFAQHLAWLLKPMPMREDRSEAFRHWVEAEILEPLLPANADLVDRLALMVRANVERLSEEFSNGGIGADR